MRTSAPPDYGPHEIAGSSLADVIPRSGRNLEPGRREVGGSPAGAGGCSFSLHPQAPGGRIRALGSPSFDRLRMRRSAARGRGLGVRSVAGYPDISAWRHRRPLYIKYIARRFPIDVINRFAGRRAAVRRGGRRAGAAYPLLESSPSHTSHIPFAYPSHTPRIHLSWAGSACDLHKTRRARGYPRGGRRSGRGKVPVSTLFAVGRAGPARRRTAAPCRPGIRTAGRNCPGRSGR